MAGLEGLLASLVAIDSISPTLSGGAGEREMAGWCEGWLRDRGLEPRRYEHEGRPSVVARVAGRGEGPPLLLNAHLDTVGVEGMDDPFTLRPEGDRRYGRGAYDMKGSIAIMLVLAERLRESPPAGDVWLTLVSDEEDRSIGSEQLVREWLPSLDNPPVAALVLEPTEEQIGVAHKGFVWYEIEVEGLAGHGSRPDEARDAILPLGAALVELAALERAFIAASPHPLLGRASLHASIIEGGSAWSVYPAHATLRWERRTLPGEALAMVDDELARVLEAARGVNEAGVTGRRLFTRDPMASEPDSPLLARLARAAPDAQRVGLSFWTDGALFAAAGLDTLIYGPIGHGAHADDEWVSLTSLERVLEVVERVVRDTG